jgi:hemerythrin-like domain-containing protein
MPPAPQSPSVPGPGSPLDTLAAWHRRGETCLALLQGLLQRRAGTPVDRVAAAAVLDYFDASDAVHHEDEERDLYPALIESMAGSDAVCLREMTDGATALHRRLESLWDRLRPSVAALAAGQDATLDAACAEALAETCAQLFRQEDRELLPMARRLLDDDALAAIAAAMDARRRAFDRRS